ncbi:ROK family protein (putative glucokinase) [Parapedobacter composti]|uniref:ROK family protein (Putative glucokinase) n=1 Tax=Parapedobacter composti TaxID=623281 RepID=A0A1I1KIS6_9SPHI|nr:ROK family transcriptional regulator [Parapedobacter composti]SFC58588.1 ROK family protein (putative glucokinase) [Parapedobacter composti]
MTQQSTTFFEDLHSPELSGVAYKNVQLKKRILTLFANDGNTTLTDLSKTLNISIPKANELVNELIVDGLAKDYGKTGSGVGRKPNMYGLEPDSAFFVGVEVKNFYINIGLMDFKRNLIKASMEIPYHLNNTEDSLNILCSSIDGFIGNSAVPWEKILGIGVNLTGRINYRTGYSYSFFNFHEDPLSKIIESVVGIHTYLENDSRAMAYGEFCSGGVKDEKNVLFVNLDHGIGMGIMVNGQLYYGKSGFAGELGHIPMFSNEILCHCGKKGCLETEASGQALTRLFQEKINQGASSIVTNKRADPDDIMLEDIIEAANNDDTLAIELITEAGEKIGKAMATLVNLFNPELIILGGALAATGDYIKLPIKNALNKYSLSLVNNDTQLTISQLGDKAGIIGACLLVRDRLLAITS